MLGSSMRSMGVGGSRKSGPGREELQLRWEGGAGIGTVDDNGRSHGWEGVAMVG